MYTILLIVLVLLLVGALPTWPYSTGWGYYPSGGLGLVLVIVLVLVLMGRVTTHRCWKEAILHNVVLSGREGDREFRLADFLIAFFFLEQIL
jgi:hypothetical protein